MNHKRNPRKDPGTPPKVSSAESRRREIAELEKNERRNKFDIETFRGEMETLRKSLTYLSNRIECGAADNAVRRAEALMTQAEDRLKRLDYIAERLTLDVTHQVLMLILGELARVRTPETSPVLDKIAAAIDKAAAETKR